MKIQEALIAWNAPITDRGSVDSVSFQSPVKVVKKTQPFPSGWADGYRSSGGACEVDWCEADDAKATLEILLMFRRLALQGIPPIDVHHAFLEIDGYKHAGGHNMLEDGSDFTQ